jgi:hypothetical protein
VAVTNAPYGDDILDEATQLLRQHTDAGWIVVSADILHRAIAAFRSSEPVRGRYDLGDFFVSSTVIVAQLHNVIDRIPHAAATKITCVTDDQRHLAELTIQIIAACGTYLLTLADQIHHAAAEILGDHPVRRRHPLHVHIGDITDDPRDVL